MFVVDDLKFYRKTMKKNIILLLSNFLIFYLFLPRWKGDLRSLQRAEQQVLWQVFIEVDCVYVCHCVCYVIGYLSSTWSYNFFENGFWSVTYTSHETKLTISIISFISTYHKVSPSYHLWKLRFERVMCTPFPPSANNICRKSAVYITPYPLGVIQKWCHCVSGGEGDIVI